MPPGRPQPGTVGMSRRRRPRQPRPPTAGARPWQRTRRSTSSARSTGRRSTTPLRQAEKELAHAVRLPRHRGGDHLVRRGGGRPQAETEERVKAALEVFKEKLVKRNISLKSLDAGEPRAVRQDLQDRLQDHPGHRLGQGQGDQQEDPRRGAQGRAGADPGRPAAGDRQEEGRPAGGHLAAQGRATSASRCSSPTTADGVRRRGAAASVARLRRAAGRPPRRPHRRRALLGAGAGEDLVRAPRRPRPERLADRLRVASARASAVDHHRLAAGPPRQRQLDLLGARVRPRRADVPGPARAGHGRRGPRILAGQPRTDHRPGWPPRGTRTSTRYARATTARPVPPARSCWS